MSATPAREYAAKAGEEAHGAAAGGGRFTIEREMPKRQLGWKGKHCAAVWGEQAKRLAHRETVNSLRASATLLQGAISGVTPWSSCNSVMRDRYSTQPVAFAIPKASAAIAGTPTRHTRATRISARRPKRTP